MEFVTRPDDVFVATYPRSGTTLAQWLVYVLAHGPEISAPHVTRVAPWFERSLAIGEVDAADLESVPSPRVFKTHLPRRWLPDGARYIYVEREVADVLISYFHFYRDYLGFSGTLDEFYDRFMSGRVQYGSWFEHVAGWRAHAVDPHVLILRYEDLVQNRRKGAETIAHFMGWSLGDGAVESAVRETGFEQMKARERIFDHATALLLERGVTPESFLRSGTTGQGAEVLSNTQLDALNDAAPSGKRVGLRGLAAFLR